MQITGRLLLGDGLVEGALFVESGHIARIARGRVDAETAGHIIAPGFIDLQVNGGFGVEVSDGSAAVAQISKRLPETGVTAYLPTVVSADDGVYRNLRHVLDSLAGGDGARALGFHLEGPLLSVRRAGAHAVGVIEERPGEAFRLLLESGSVRLVTVAPERNGAIEWIGELRQRGIVVSLGHTDAGYEQTMAGFDAGATMATHLFNAMSPFLHRSPGAVGAVLVDDRIIAGLIVDGIHSHPAAVKLAVRAKGSSKVALVTDMMAAAGMPPGTYPLGGRKVESDGRRACLPDHTLAGSVLTMDAAVRNAVQWGGMSIEQALRSASEVPARVLGLKEVGTLSICNRADLVVLDESLGVAATMVGGIWRYCRQAGASTTRYAGG